MAKILIVDDAAFFRLMLKEVLEKSGHQILLAEDGEEGANLAIAKAKEIDLIILDMVLPKKTGLEVLMDIVDLKIKTLCVTGNDRVEELDELRELGANDIINKSSPLEEIVYRVNQLLFPNPQDGPRRHHRVMVQLQVTCRAASGAFTGQTFTLSDQGLFIQTPKPFAKDEIVELSFYLPLSDQAGKEIECKGKVVWIDDGTKPGTVQGMGIAFTEMHAFDRQIISDYIEAKRHTAP